MSATSALLQSWNRLVGEDPNRAALIDAQHERRWTRIELDRHARALAQTLPPDLARRRVVFTLPNGADWLALFIALQRAGAVAVPLDPTETPEAQERLAAELHAAAVWREPHWLRFPRPHRAGGDASPCLLKLTSGSSGRPRPLPFTAAEMWADGDAVCRTMGITPDDLNLAIIPFGHSYGLGNLVVPLLAQGTPILLARAPLPRVVAEDVARWRPTVFPAVPALLRLLTQAELPVESLAPLRTIISAGARLDPEVAAGFRTRFGRAVHGFYGSSETGGICYDRTGDATAAGRSVGPPLEGVTLRFTTGGRFWVESAAVYSIGNRHRSATGPARHRPADTATLNAAGELVLRGRAGRMVKIDGRRLDLTELEHALRRIDGIVDAHALPHAERPDAVVAALQTTLPPAEVRARLGRHLAAWKIPRRLLCLPEFPLTARGKPDLAELRRRLTG